MGRNTKPKCDLFDLVDAVNMLPPESLALATGPFLEDYTRRSVKRLPGTRLASGEIEPPCARLEPAKDARCYIRRMVCNQNDASLQLATIQAGALFATGSDAQINEVNFVSTREIPIFRSYTVLSSGELNVTRLPLQVLTKIAWQALQPFMLPSQAKKTFKAGTLVNIELRRFGLNRSVPSGGSLAETVDKLYRCLAQYKILSGLRSSADASPYTPEQIKALGLVHLSPALYFSAPSTVPYTDRDEAISRGEVDFYTKYKVYFGGLDLLNPGAFRSGNALVSAYYDGVIGEVVDKKPKLADVLRSEVELRPKTKKVEPNEADQLMLAALGRLRAELQIAGPAGMKDCLEQAFLDTEESLSDLRDSLLPLVFYIGCRGMLPPDLAASMEMFTADDFATKFSIKLKKDEAEGTYYVDYAGLVISIVPESCEYTPSKKDEAL
jgi:hypothetical protein